MNILALESTCDETAAAILTDALVVKASVVASQDELHKRFGGVVPEIASRAHLERILPVIHQALEQAEMTLGDLDAVAVANTPGLAGSLLVGLVAAKALCVARNLPLVAVNHLQAHIYACHLTAAPQSVFPCIGLIVSGGHTSLYRCLGPLDFELLGATIDDAAGEAFDKVAAMLGLPYPGGPAIQRAAANGHRKTYSFPRSFYQDDERLDFTQLDLPPQQVADLAASFQEAVVDTLVDKAFAALRRIGLRTLCVGGGVAANSRLRERLEEEARHRDVELHVAPLRLCTDNAVMGAIAVERLKAGLTENLDLDVYPGVLRKRN